MTNTIPNVPRELLERCAQYTPTLEKQEDRARALSELRAILSAPSPAGVDGLEVVAYRVSLPSEPELGTWLDEDAENEPQMCLHEPLCRLSDAQAVIDGLRAEVESRVEAALAADRAVRHQQAQRIGELEGLLREVHDTYRAAIHWEDLRGTMKRIDTALSVGKEGE